ncbi:ATPase family AAA domain-containing protein 5 [Staphylotrichum tortipilum]|uniref:ATPase family AAA domain-containing protein 5 n=1 Tax=Staphylotrichum tortipilum TaxID=2831512 RepID=A0AAN6MS92_9PEZI|nr:ATPase family AAA domain-containing protein 5 [Staphylotrichum longicolle]
MGSLAVLTMADNPPPADPAARRPVHPFFAQNRPATPADKPVMTDGPEPSDNPALSSNTAGSDRVEDGKPENPPVQQSGRRRKADEQDEEEMLKKPPPRKRIRNSTGPGIAQHFVKSGKENENNKLNDTESLGADTAQKDVLTSCPLEEPDGCNSTPAANVPKLQGPANIAVSNHLVPEPATTDRTADAKPTKPVKFLQFNPKTGTIGSPPKPKQSRSATEDTCNTEKQPSGRRGKKSTSKVVRVAYGTDSKTRVKLGELINSILAGQAQCALPQSVPKSEDTTSVPKTPATPATLASLAPKPSKATHPFFMGQPKKPEPAPVEPKPKKAALSPISARTKHYSSTPCSPRKLSPKRPHAAPIPKIPRPQFGVKNLGLKFPGTKTPAWPWRGMVHVRGNGGAQVLEQAPLPLASRKSKGNAVKVSPAESIISLLADSLNLPAMAEAVRNINTDEFIPPPPELRLPQKHFESGTKLQSRILPELRTFQPMPPAAKKAPTLGEDPLQRSNVHTVQPPPQLARLFVSIASSLSAFDTSQCETSNWVQKYAPRSAVEVLQPGQEAFFLRDWLQTLMVQSVDTGSTDADKSKAGPKSKAASAGKKKRRKKLDGFIVSSEDEDYELYEPSDEDEDWAPSGSRGIFRKTIVRSGKLGKGKDGEKTANALVMSGPHGCGKTAAVYAVAKELGFEVFEINPSSRRSGKDVLERIGDMTKNHHVRQHQLTSTPADQSAGAEDNTAEDIKSGKQATMNAFFKPKTISGAKPKQPIQLGSKSLQNNAKKEPPKTQRQSLILLDEVDILFEEDKQFWTTIVSLITQAKRPFIMTCNDETFVPLHTMRLHGIFRLSSPPRDLSVDRLILVAANEGHALTRESVEQLYDSRNRDLRATTMDLQYWCQMGVGDRRGGFDWFYPRWPKGADLDENKEVVRAVSQDTYRSGMNLLVRDGLVDPNVAPQFAEEEVLYQSWESWGVDLGHWQDSTGLGSWAESLGPNTSSPSSRLSALEAYDNVAEAMSAADICSSRSFAGFKEETFDPTQPEPSSKTKDDFVLSIIHLDTPVISHHNTLTTAIPSSIKSLAKASLQLLTAKPQGSEHPLRPLDEPRAIQCLHSSFTSTHPGTSAIGRIEFAFAFDPIAAASPSPVSLTAFLEPSVFDRTLKLIVLDVAPYVRGIVAYEAHLQKQRLKLSSLVSEGGRASRGSKRMRTTRAALSAMEGGSRSTTRSERWFKADLNPYLVAKTAGKYFTAFEAEGLKTPEKSSSSTKNSPETSPDTTPTKTPREAVQKGRKRKVVLQEDDKADELGC